ncbi:MAG: Pr6Pr family membrane protein [Actinobacteria bacterium]|nr:Pr6Pr family membrane protein [Actinomycetota bacterium]
MRGLYATVRPWLRLVSALLVVVAIAAQCQRLSSDDVFKPVNVFSFFTIQSNLAAVFVLLGLELRDSAVARLARRIRPGVVLYMAMTGIVYAVLLAPASADVGLTAKWVDTIVHVIAPIVVVADWFLDPPSRRPVLRDIWAWMIFPIVWLGYSLIRGAIVDWYPYPFLDPREVDDRAAGSWWAVALMTSVVAAGAVLFACLLVRCTRSRPAPVA